MYDTFCYIIRQYYQYPDITLPTNVCLVKAMVFPQSCMDVRVGL